MQAEELLEKLEEAGIDHVINQSFANNMAGGVELCSLCGNSPGLESIITEDFMPSMPDAQPSMALDEQKFEALSLTNDTKLEPS